MKTLYIRVPRPIPCRPIDFRDCAPLGDPFSRRKTFLILHAFGYRWMPRAERWHIPKRPSQRFRVKEIEP